MPGLEHAATEFPSGLPSDGVQPWEQLDSNGRVAAPDREAASINGNTDFTPGIERFLEAGDVTDNGEASRLNGTDESGTSYAMYRVSLGAQQPGIVSIDANLLGSGSRYYVGLSDYGSSRWDWRGPFTDSHVRLQAVTEAGGQLTSTLGNTFVMVLVDSGSSIDVVGIGVNTFDLADSTAPAAVSGLSLSAVAGGLELAWAPVLANDLAGYSIHSSSSEFSDPAETGVRSVPYLEGATRHLLADLTGPTWVCVLAHDFAGNSSDVGDILVAEPLAGTAPSLQLDTDLVSAGIGETVQLTASGADSYDWDLDGDGIFEITGDAGGSQLAYTGSTGIIRPAVRGLSGEAVALGAVSLIVVANTRPTASISSDKTQDYVNNIGFPIPEITFTGEAQDLEDPLEDLTFSWDFDGDGVFEADTDTLAPDPVEYEFVGTYNVRLRVEDLQGAWQVAVWPISIRMNMSPQVEFFNYQEFVFYRPDGRSWREFMSLDAWDPENDLLSYAWDPDGDGTYDITDESSPESIQYFWDLPGIYQLGVRVSDSSYNSVYVHRQVHVQQLVSEYLVDSGSVGMYSDCQPWLGGIGVVFLDSVGDELEFVRSYDAAGTSWTGRTVISGTDSVIGRPSLLNTGNSLVACYKDATSGKLRSTYLSKGVPTWTAPIDVDDTSDQTGLWSDLVLAENRVCVVYYDEDNGNVKFARANSRSPSSWPTVMTVHTSSDDVGQYCQVILADGNPAICYYNATDGDLMYARANNAQGTDWDVIQTLVEDGDSGRWCSMINGFVDRPTISYLKDDSNELFFLLASNDAGSAWGNPKSIVSNVSGEGSNALTYFNGGLILAYENNSRLYFATSESAVGSLWDVNLLQDFEGDDTGHNSAWCMVGTRAVLTYYDLDNTDLKIAVGRY